MNIVRLSAISLFVLVSVSPSFAAKHWHDFVSPMKASSPLKVASMKALSPLKIASMKSLSPVKITPMKALSPLKIPARKASV